ncbi:urea ABC transporter urea binding protein [Candidatus Magnetoovum chiemensis]|nr:urea ABC transporter urea binding protein [Candidatus Magnetoovum chiemensis]
MTKTIQIGILHSLTGTMSISEKPLVDALLLAVDEINKSGGVLGCMIGAKIEDGASSPNVFQQKMQSLIDRDNITSIFGCWTSATRKAVKPIIEACNGLLWYPVQYEGLEQSENIVYCGSCLNQQIEPAINWIFSKKWSRVFLVGSNYVFPRTANMLVRALAENMGGEIAGDEYIPLGDTDFRRTISRILQSKPNIVFNTINGDSNLSFYKQYNEAGISYEDIPVLAVSFSEVEAQKMIEYAYGHYTCWSYFQSLNNRENLKFINSFKHKYGADRVTADPIVAAYSQVYLWKQAVEKCQSFEACEIGRNLYGLSYLSPGGEIHIERNNHVVKKAYIGQLDRDGQFQIIWDSGKEIKPKHWLGIEDLNFPAKNIVIDALRILPDVIHNSFSLEKRIDDEVKDRVLKEQMLIQQSKMASMGEMIGAIAHQWRQPLNAVGAIVNDIGDAYNFGELDKPYMESSIKEIKEQLKHMSNTINDFTQFFKPTKDKTSFSIRKALDEVINLVRYPFITKNITIETNYTYEADLTVNGYVNEFKHVVINIINNSKDAIIENNRKGRIGIDALLEDGAAVIRIWDNGGGIREDLLQNIFCPYFTTKADGMGIGLYISKVIVEKNMAGKLDVENIEDGALFTVRIKC